MRVMASTSSFDVVSDFDRQELVNTLDQVRRDVGNRYDLKDSNTEIELEETELVITTASDMTLQAVEDVNSFMEFLSELYENGDMEKICGTVGVVLGLGYLLLQAAKPMLHRWRRLLRWLAHGAHDKEELRMGTW